MDSSRGKGKRKRHTVDEVQPREVQKYSDVNLHWEVRRKLKGSGFDLMFDMAHKVSIIKPLLVALIRRYDPKSGLFELGQQKNIKLLFGLQDVFRITGLPIDGKPVCLDTQNVKKLGAGEFTILTGLKCDKTTIPLQTLVDEINNSFHEFNSKVNIDRIDQICRIVALLGIGCMVMQGGHSQIRIDYVCLLRDVDDIKNYAWGAASWANLHSSLISIAMRDGTNLFGSVFALMVFALVRIPKLISYCYRQRNSQSLENLSFPMMIDFTNIIRRDEMVDGHDRVECVDFEGVLLGLDENDVMWNYSEILSTYENENDGKYYEQELLGISVTMAIAESFAVKHQPHLAPQQFPGCNINKELIRHWLEDFPTEILGRKKRKGNSNLYKEIWEQRWNRLMSMEMDVSAPQNHDPSDPPQTPEPPQSHEPSSSQPSLHSDAELSDKWKKKLVVFDINGLLADVVFPIPKDSHRVPDEIFHNKAIFMRPSCVEFLEFCFDKFEVGIWSSKMRKNVDKIIDRTMGNIKNKFLFCWDRSYCTVTNFRTPENKNIVFKDLKKLWDKADPDLPWEKGYYNESNTLLVDDSPYKALLNPPNTSIFPHSFSYKVESDNSLAEGGNLRVYLDGLANAKDMRCI